MAKTKPYHLHKIKIHRNRWLMWAISYAVIVAFAVWGYIKVTDVTFNQQFAAENTFTPTHTYNDSRLDFGIRYPADWSIEADSDSISFSPINSNEEGVTIKRVALGAEESIREKLDITSEKVITIGDTKAAKITNDLGHNALETVVLVKHGGNLYVIEGSGTLVNAVLTTFRFIN